MNLLSGTTWKGAKLRIGEAKPDFRERYGTPHFYGPSPTNWFLLTLLGSNARTMYLQITDRPKSVALREAPKAFTP